MKKIILGASLALLINYCIGATYVIYRFTKESDLK